MFSNNLVARELVRRLHTTLERFGITLVVVPIPGLDNIADCPTRSEVCCEARRKATWLHIENHSRGYQLETNVNRTKNAGAIRHSEEDDDICSKILSSTMYEDPTTEDGLSASDLEPLPQTQEILAHTLDDPTG